MYRVQLRISFTAVWYLHHRMAGWLVSRVDGWTHCGRVGRISRSHRLQWQNATRLGHSFVVRSVESGIRWAACFSDSFVLSSLSIDLRCSDSDNGIVCLQLLLLLLSHLRRSSSSSQMHHFTMLMYGVDDSTAMERSGFGSSCLLTTCLVSMSGNRGRESTLTVGRTSPPAHHSLELRPSSTKFHIQALT